MEMQIMTGTRFPRHTLLGGALALLVAFAPPARASVLTYVETLKPGVGGVTGIKNANGAAVSPDGLHVYVAGNGDDTLVTFARDPASGALTWRGLQQDGVNGVDGLKSPDEVLVSPDGRHVFVSCDDAVVVFARNAATGLLAYVQTQKRLVGGINGLGAPFGLAISPDGAYLYVVGFTTFTVTVFARNATSGSLTLVEEKTDGSDGVSGMQGPQRIAMSPDAAHVYVASTTSNSLAVFSRNAATGRLAFVEKQQDGVNGVTGLGGAVGVTVSGDGKHVYAGGYGSAIAVFARDAGTGMLSFVESEHEGVNGVTGIEDCFSFAVSPDGLHLFTTGAQDSALAVFDRDPATGTLTFVEADVRSPDLSGVNTVAQSPDGMDLYTTAWDGNAATVFRRTAAPSTTSTSTTTTTSPSTSTTGPSSSTTTTTLPGCGPSPEALCKQALASRLRLHTGATGARNRLTWLWTGGSQTTLGDFGDPTTATDYRLCIYDHVTTSPTLVLDAEVPAGGMCNDKPCWRRHRAGLRFRSTGRAESGISQVDLKPGREGNAGIAVQGHGASLPFPALPLTTPVRVELRASNGSCWAASAKVGGKGAIR
jgi:6-phosphogluconolactonase (cycloisomerase 2 family)